MKRLTRGDKLAAVSLSWGGAAEFPQRYLRGKEELERRFGVELIAMPNALKSAQWLYDNPQARAADLVQAFADPDIRGVVSVIGGDDSIRLLPHIDESVLAANPKPFIGYSDSTVTHLLLHKLGIKSFYGPAVLAGFAENGGMFRYTEQAVRHCLFGAGTGLWPVCKDNWTNAKVDFSLPYQQARDTRSTEPRKAIGGRGKARGHLLGGCVEALEFCVGTPIWPSLEDWRGAILFIEIADGENLTSPTRFSWCLRNLGAQGILAELSGVLFARPGESLPVDRYVEYEQVLQRVLKEYGKAELPVISRMEFGHTDPMYVLPYGIDVEINGDDCSVTYLNSAFD